MKFHSSALGDLKVNLFSEDNEDYSGHILDAWSRGGDTFVIADFPKPSSPAFPLGEEAALIFSGDMLPSPLGLRGIAVFRTEDAYRSRYHFQIDQESAESLGGIVNRRRAVRVMPISEGDVQVLLRGESGCGPMEARLTDISSTGMSVIVNRAEENTLFSSWHLDFTLFFTRDEHVVEAKGSVRYRKLAGDSIQYGIEFDWEDSGESRAMQEIVIGYVMGRQAAD